MTGAAIALWLLVGFAFAASLKNRLAARRFQHGLEHRDAVARRDRWLVWATVLLVLAIAATVVAVMGS